LHCTYDVVLLIVTAAGIGVYVSLLPHTDITVFATDDIIEDRQRSEEQCDAAILARAHAIRAFAYRVPPPRITTDCAVQLLACEEYGRPVPSANRRHGSKTNGGRC
jgi:hypothetical protein